MMFFFFCKYVTVTIFLGLWVPEANKKDAGDADEEEADKTTESK